ncbi:MAG: helix-turn-helix domain-containing protein [Chloroflexota bacterium]
MNRKKPLQYWQEYKLEYVSMHEMFLRKKVVGDALVTDVTSYEWLFVQIDFHEGVAQFRIDGEAVTVGKGVYGFFAPPFSIYHCRFEAGRADMRAHFSIIPKPRALPNSPMLFRWRGRPFEGHFADVITALNATDEFLYAKVDEFQDNLARRIKTTIDQTFETACPLAQLAGQLGISPAHFSRVFKKKYGLTAVDYRGKLRSVWAAQQLARSENRNISDVAFEMGYNDLGRFNKQFRRHMRMTPGAIKKLGDR